MIQRPILIVIACATATSAFAQQPQNSCPAELAALNRVSSEFKPQLDSISARGDDLKKDSEKKSDLSLEFKVDMKEHHWIFDLPSVTMRDQRIVIGIPEFRMNTREFSFDVPETVMVAKKVGQYPETIVNGFNVTIRWKDIITHVPEVRMVRKSFKMDIPETRLTDTAMIFGVPDVRMERQDWYVKIPEFTLKKIEVAGVPVYNDFDKRGKELEKSANEVKSDMKTTLIQRTSALFTCLRAFISNQRATAIDQMKKGIAQVDDSIKSLAVQGISSDSVKIMVDGREKTLTQQRDELYAAFAAMEKKFSDTVQALDNDEKASVARIGTS
jgi:hypothetical protein